MKKILYTLSVLSLIFLGGFTYVKANPSQFSKTVETSAATTTASFVGVGTGTTTLTYDAYTGSSTCGTQIVTSNAKQTNAALLTQFAASSTSSVLGVSVEYSHDCVDWYQDSVNPVGTATPMALITSLNAVNTFTWAANTVATTSKAVMLATPTRYLRVKYTLTGAAGAVWGQIVPNKERSE